MIFSWLKLGIGLLTLFICLAIVGIAWLIITKMAFDLTTSIAIGCSAFLVAVAVYYIIMGRLGYSIKMGHLAIVERAHRGENIPSNPVEFSKNIVSTRFGSNRQFYGYSRSVVLIIRELVRVISKGFTLELDKPDISSSRWIKHLFASSALRCSDECCLAYALRRSDYEVNAAVVDALTFFVQEWKTFINKALKVSLLLLLVCILTFAVFFLPGFFIFRDLGLNVIPWLGISFFLMLTVKVAFFDSYVLTKIVCEFLHITDSAKIKTQNYVKLDSWSKRYAKLREAAEKAAEKAEDAADRAERAARKNAKESSISSEAEESVPSEAPETEQIVESVDEENSESSTVID